MGDLLSSISVLLVFLTFLLNGLQQQAEEILEIIKPGNDQKSKTDKINKKILMFFWIKCFPVSLTFGLVFYVLLPKAINIINASVFKIWNFDILDTVFILIEVGVIGLTIFAIYKSIQIVNKYYEKII